MAKFSVCAEDAIDIDAMKAFTAGDTNIIVYHLADGFYATQSKCTHLFASMEKGKLIEGCKIQCPFHRARFDIRTGEVVDWANFPPGVQLLNFVRSEKALATYPVTIEDGKLVVEIEST